MTALFTVEQVAELITKSAYTVRKMARNGRIPGARKIGRDWRFPHDKVARMIGAPAEGGSR
jgi:excisionase family DNA binding protein